MRLGCGLVGWRVVKGLAEWGNNGVVVPSLSTSLCIVSWPWTIASKEDFHPRVTVDQAEGL